MWYVGQRNPSITETLTIDGDPIDLVEAGSVVRFKGREVGSSALLVDQQATIVQTGQGVGAVDKGEVRYDWSAADAQTTAPVGILGAERTALVWWEETSGGKTQHMGEAVIEVRAHAPESAYVELEELKKTNMLSGESFADLDIQPALVSASRIVDNLCHRGELGFRIAPTVPETRYYSASRGASVHVDDLVAITSVKTDPNATGTYSDTWVENADYLLEPVNAVGNGRPWEYLRGLSTGSYSWPPYPRAIQVVGRFGWSAVPQNVKDATVIIATRIVKRKREAAFGVVLTGGMEGGAIRALGLERDSELMSLLKPYKRRQVLA
jgi:hypothetical protein